MKRSIKTNIMVLLTFITLVTSLFGVAPAYAAPAAPTVLSPGYGSYITNNTPTISGTTDVGSSVYVGYWDLVDLATLIPICNDIAEDGSGNWSCVPSTPLPDGEIVLLVAAVDETGTSDPATSHMFYVDTTSPQASIDDGPYNPTNSTTATFSFSATDNLTAAPNFTFWCRLDGLSWEDCSSDPGTWSYTGLDEGWHYFTLFVYDEAGNSDFVYWDWFVDLTPPDVYFEVVPPKITTQTDAEFEIWATDNFSGDNLAKITRFWGLNFFCKLDDGAWDVCEFYMPLQLYYNGLASGEHTLYLDTYDEAGNLTSISYSWCVNFCTAKEPTTNWIAPNGLPQGVSMREQHLTSFTEFNTWINGKAYKLAPPKPWLLFAGAAVQLDSTVPLKKPVKICFYYPKASYTEGKWTGKIYFLDGTKWIGRSTTQEVVDGFPYLCTNATQPGIYIVVDGWAK